MRPLALAVAVLVLAGCGGGAQRQPAAAGKAFATLPGIRVAQLLEDGHGRILAVGIDDAARAFAVRLSHDGSVDQSFGAHGYVRWPYARFLGWNAAALLPDGRIVLAGSTRFGVADTQSVLVLTALTANGSIDRGFGHQGYVATTQKSCLRGPTGIAAAADRIFVSVLRTCTPQSGGSIVLMRFDGHGRTDTTFGSRGIAPISGIPGTVPPSAPLVLDAEKRIAAALVGGVPGTVVVTRFLNDGSRDPTFGSHGVTVAHVDANSLSTYVESLFAAKVRRLTVTGCTEAGPFLLRLNPNGTPYHFWGGGPVGSLTNIEHFGGAFGSRCAAFGQLPTHELVAAGAALARIYASGFVDVHEGLQALPGFEPFAAVPTHRLLAAADGSIFVATRVRKSAVIQRFR